MTDERERENVQGDDQSAPAIGATNYAASAAEAGSVYSDRGPTLADVEGDPVGDPSDDADADGGAGAGAGTTNDAGPSIGDVQRSGL